MFLLLPGSFNQTAPVVLGRFGFFLAGIYAHKVPDVLARLDKQVVKVRQRHLSAAEQAPNQRGSNFPPFWSCCTNASILVADSLLQPVSALRSTANKTHGMPPLSASGNVRIPSQAGEARSASASRCSGLSGGLRSRRFPCGRKRGRARRIRCAMEPAPRDTTASKRSSGDRRRASSSAEPQAGWQ